MHSSRMHTVRSSNPLLGGAWSGGLFLGGAPGPGGAWFAGGGIPTCTEAEPPPWTDTHLLKHNLRVILI